MKLKVRKLLLSAAILIGLGLGGMAMAQSTGADAWPKVDEELWTQSALEKSNLEKPRPSAAFDMTGTWTLKVEPENGGVNFLPLPKLMPAAQKMYDEGVKANAEGKPYHDDVGQCWPFGMPKWWTRVWPIQFMQYPTMIVAIQGLFNSTRWVYLDGRGHANPDLSIATYNGDSIARFEGDTLVIDTINIDPKRHWAHQGIPVSDKLHIVERIKMASDRESFSLEIVMTDQENWVGEWKGTKTFVRVKDEDVVESHCLPDGNEGLSYYEKATEAEKAQPQK